MCDVQRSLTKTKSIISIAQALVHKIYTNEDYNHSDYNYEFLNDALWKASSTGLESIIIDPLDEKIISMKDMVLKMIEYCKPSLRYFDNLDVIENILDILNKGPESYQQIEVYNDKGFKGLKEFLINKVKYIN